MPQPIQITPQTVMPPPRQPRPLTLQRKGDGAIFQGTDHDPSAWLQAFLTFYQFGAPLDDDARGQRCMFNYGPATLDDVIRVAIAQGALAGYDVGYDQVMAIAVPLRQAALPPTPDGSRAIDLVYTIIPYTGHVPVNNAQGGHDAVGVQIAAQVNFAFHREEPGWEVPIGGSVTAFADPDGTLHCQQVAASTGIGWASTVIQDLLTLQGFAGMLVGASRQQSSVAGVMKMFPVAQATPAGGSFMFTLPGMGGRIQIGGQLAAQFTTGLRDSLPTTFDFTTGIVIQVEVDKRDTGP